MIRRLLSLTLGGLISLLIPSQLRGQALERVLPPIEVHVSPASAPTLAKTGDLVLPEGAKVTIAGNTVPLGTRGTDVRVEVKPPAGAVATLNVPISADGTWSTTLAATDNPGKYNITAFTADGKNSAAASFVVLSGDDFDSLAGEVERLAREAADTASALANARAALAAKGPYPEQEAVEQRLSDVALALEGLPARLKTGREGLARLGGIARQYPGGAAELEPLTTAVQEGVQKTSEAADRVRQAGAAAGRTLGVCDRIDAVNEVLGAASLWFDLQGLLFQKIVQLATDKYLPDRIYNAAVPVATQDNTEKLALGESLKGVASAFNGVPAGGTGAAADGLIDFVSKPQNLLLDTTQMLTGLAFDTLCERFTGPVSGTFTVVATINGGHKFWGYTTAISGRLTLMFEKQLVHPGEPIPMTGDIEGNGAFTMYEDLMAFNEFNRQFVLYRTLIPPLGTSAAAQGAIDPLGKVARMATPGYFRVPVSGELKGNALTITIGDTASSDFADTLKGRAVYVVLAPAAPLPYTMMSNIPVQKAQFILSRGLRTTAVLPVATAHRKPVVKTAARSFDRKEVVSNGDVTVTWKLDVKACNPACR